MASTNTAAVAAERERQRKLAAAKAKKAAKDSKTATAAKNLSATADRATKAGITTSDSSTPAPKGIDVGKVRSSFSQLMEDAAGVDKDITLESLDAVGLVEEAPDKTLLGDRISQAADSLENVPPGFQSPGSGPAPGRGAEIMVERGIAEAFAPRPQLQGQGPPQRGTFEQRTLQNTGDLLRGNLNSGIAASRLGGPEVNRGLSGPGGASFIPPQENAVTQFENNAFQSPGSGPPLDPAAQASLAAQSQGPPPPLQSGPPVASLDEQVASISDSLTDLKMFMGNIFGGEGAPSYTPNPNLPPPGPLPPQASPQVPPGDPAALQREAVQAEGNVAAAFAVEPQGQDAAPLGVPGSVAVSPVVPAGPISSGFGGGTYGAGAAAPGGGRTFERGPAVEYGRGDEFFGEPEKQAGKDKDTISIFGNELDRDEYNQMVAGLLGGMMQATMAGGNGGQVMLGGAAGTYAGKAGYAQEQERRQDRLSQDDITNSLRERTLESRTVEDRARTNAIAGAAGERNRSAGASLAERIRHNNVNEIREAEKRADEHAASGVLTTVDGKSQQVPRGETEAAELRSYIRNIIGTSMPKEVGDRFYSEIQLLAKREPLPASSEMSPQEQAVWSDRLASAASDGEYSAAVKQYIEDRLVKETIDQGGFR